MNVNNVTITLCIEMDHDDVGTGKKTQNTAFLARTFQLKVSIVCITQLQVALHT